jgi:hypothetical protein
MDSGILLQQDSILVCSPNLRILQTAGDAFFAGFCWIVATQDIVTVEQVGRFASLVARQRCGDTCTRNILSHKLHDLWTMVQTGTNLPHILP